MGFACFLGFRLALIAVFFTFPLASLSINHSSRPDKLKEIFTWKALDFDFPNEAEREAAIRSKSFIPGSLLPIDVDVYNGGGTKKIPTVFITVPRFQRGVPVTLGYVTDKINSVGDPLIAPYPNWEMQKPGPNCAGITSVFRIAVDPCHRLWVLDTGKIEDDRICPPQLLVYSLQTDSLLKRYIFPKEQYTDASLFITPLVDIRDNCDNVFVYIADVGAFSLIVYDDKNSKSWKIVNNLFYPYPNDGTFEINNESFDLMDGIFGLALEPMSGNRDKMLYFHSLASRTESYVRTSVIRNSSLFEEVSYASPRSFKNFDHLRSSQSAAQAMDANGVLFYSLISDVAIGCWNSRRHQAFRAPSSNIVVMNKETLQFASGMKVITPSQGRQQELWVMTVSFQKFMTGSLSSNMTNFRIQAGEIEHLVRGTDCESSAHDANSTLYLITKF